MVLPIIIFLSTIYVWTRELNGTLLNMLPTVRNKMPTDTLTISMTSPSIPWAEQKNTGLNRKTSDKWAKKNLINSRLKPTTILSLYSQKEHNLISQSDHNQRHKKIRSTDDIPATWLLRWPPFKLSKCNSTPWTTIPLRTTLIWMITFDKLRINFVRIMNLLFIWHIFLV